MDVNGMILMPLLRVYITTFIAFFLILKKNQFFDFNPKELGNIFWLYRNFGQVRVNENFYILG